MKQLYNFENVVSFETGGFVGERLAAQLEHWTLSLPYANPALFQKLRNRSFHNLPNYTGGQHEYLGKYLTGAAYAYAMNRDERLETVIRYTIDQLGDAQDPSGYLGPARAGDRYICLSADETKKRYTWDVWCHYHAILGLLLCHRVTGYERALTIALSALDNVLAFFDDKPLSAVRCGFTNLAIGHVSALMYEQTGNRAYLAFAERAVEAMADPQSEAGNYFEGTLEGKAFYELPNTRWEGLHAIEALYVLHRITQKPAYAEAYEKIWRSTLMTDRHNTGGFTSDERAVGNPYDLRVIETCCTLSWIVLSTNLLMLKKESYIADEIEMSVYNGIFSAQHPSGRHSTYNTPMIGDKKASIHEIVFQSIAGAPETNCCSVNIGRALCSMADWGVVPAPEGLYIHYYGQSRAHVRMPDGREVTVTQETGYPVDGAVRLRIDAGAPGALCVMLRIPFWSKATRVRVNGRAVERVVAGQYLALSREWSAGDLIELDFDMSIHLWIGDDVVKGKCAFYHGPLLLAYDYRFNGQTERPFCEINVEGTPTPTFSKPIHFDFSDAPAISCDASGWKRTACDQYPAPLLLYEARDFEGKAVYLCDFITAGQTGTPYTTWIPATETLTPAAADGAGTEAPIWGMRP